MNQKLRKEHNIPVLRHLIHNMMAELDPEGLKARNLQKKKREESKGSLFIWGRDMDSLLGWPWYIVWVSELNIPPGSLWLYWHILSQGLVLVCMLFQLEPYNHWQDVSSVLVWDRGNWDGKWPQYMHTFWTSIRSWMTPLIQLFLAPQLATRSSDGGEVLMKD